MLDEDIGLGEKSRLPDNELGLLSKESVGEEDEYEDNQCVSCGLNAKVRTKKSNLLPWGPRSTAHHYHLLPLHQFAL